MRFSNVVVIGGAGFVGRHLVAALASLGAQITVPVRHRARARELVVLPTVSIVESRLHDRSWLARLLRGHDLVVNLVGRLHSRRGRRDERGPNDYGPDFAQAHVELPLALVSACRSAGVRRLLHMSALGARPDAPSEYLRSKAIGERAVLAAEDLQVTVFRPSVIFGPEDQFLNLFARLSAVAPVLPLACPSARFQPVYVGDVVQAFITSLERREAIGARYDLCGPTRYTLRQLVEWVCATLGRRRLVVGLPEALSYIQAAILEWTPGPLMSRDNVRSMLAPSVCEGEFPFGLRPVALEAVAPRWLRGQRSIGRPQPRP